MHKTDQLYNSTTIRTRHRAHTYLRLLLQFIRDLHTEMISRSKKSSLRCALIEYGPVHGENLPTLIYILNALDINVDVYTSREVKINNPLIYSSRLNYTFRETEGLFFKYLVERRQFHDYDFVIVGSVEPKRVLIRISKFQIPIIAVVHNSRLIKNDPDYANFFTDTTRAPIVLAEHSSRYLSDTLNAQWIWPMYTLDRVNISKRKKICFCVQGNVEFYRRNYISLLDAIDNLVREGISNFHVVIVGRNNTEDGLTLKKEIENRNLNAFFTFSKGELSYKDYYDLIASAHFVPILIDTTKSEYMSYFIDKGTSSIFIAISLEIIPIVHKKMANLYNINDISVTYKDGGLSDALREALNIDGETLERMRYNIISRKDALSRQSILNMIETLKDLDFNVSNKYDN